MAGYVKLFSEIVESSIWDEDSDTCKVWITLLALSDQDGYVRGSPGWLAGKSRVSLGKCTLALRKFKEPDLQSKTEDNEGRRIEQLEDGWLILNYISFRDRLSTDKQSVATRERVRKHRERYNALRNGNQALHTVTSEKPVVASVDGDASVPLEGREFERREPFDPMNVPDKLKTASFMDAWGKWINYRRGFKKVKDWAALFSEQLTFVARFEAPDAEEILRTSMRNGWQGLFEPKGSRPSASPEKNQIRETINVKTL